MILSYETPSFSSTVMCLMVAIGCFQGTYHISVDTKVPPVVHPPHRIPLALRDRLKEELDFLVNQEFLTPVTYPTDWVNSCVCVTKSNGKLRLCLDSRDLNKAMRHLHYTTPTFDDILAKINGVKWFSILDARSGYCKLKLDDTSADQTTFNTPQG